MYTAYLALRSGLFYLIYSLLTIWFGLTSGLVALVSRQLAINYILYWNRLAVAIARAICGIKFQVIGADNLPSTPYVALPKHQSSWETAFFPYYLTPISMVLKRELLRIPFFGWGLYFTDHIAINRGAGRTALRSIQQQGLHKLHCATSVLLFPEGSRIPTGQVGNYARSGCELALTANAPIVPIAHNAGRYWPAHAFLKYPGTITVVIGQPIDPQGKTSRVLTQQVKQWIETEMTKL